MNLNEPIHSKAPPESHEPRVIAGNRFEDGTEQVNERGESARELERLLASMDEQTRGHSRRVAEHSVAVASAMGVSDIQIATVRYGALLHEIGKLQIPEAVLYKPAKLTNAEMRVYRTYPVIGYEMVRQVPRLADAAEIVYAHKEKFGGTGYPRGLTGAEIPLGARIVAVADAFDTFISDRPHDFLRAVRHARSEISRWSSSWFDPAVVEVFLRMPLSTVT